MKVDFSKRPKKKLLAAVFFITLFAFFTAMMSGGIKYISDEISIETIILWNYIVGVFFAVLWIFVLSPQKKGISYLKTAQIKNQAMRSLFRLASLFLFYYSLRSLAIADATLFLFTSSIFIPIIAYFWHRIGLHHEMWWGMIVAFIGIGIVINPGKEIFQFGTLLALLAAVASAFALLSLRFAHYEEPSDRTLFYNFAIAGVVAFVISLFSFETNWLSLDPHHFFWLISIGLLSLGAQISLTFATKFAPLRLLSPFMYIAVIFGMLLDWLIWNHQPTVRVYLGCALIIVGNILMLLLYPKDDLQIRKPKH